MEIREFANILGKAAITLNHTLSEQAIIAWFELFFNEEKEHFATALKVLIKEPGRRFWPTPGEVAEKIEAIKNPVRPEAAAVVWHRLLGYAQTSTPEDEVQRLETDPAVRQAITELEWRKIRYGDIEKDLPYLKAAFIKIYNSQKTAAALRDKIQITRRETALLEDLGLKPRGRIAA